MGNKAVTGMGTASEIHQMIIQAAKAITRMAGESVQIPIQEQANSKTNSNGPSHMPIAPVRELEISFWVEFTCSVI